MSPFNRTRLLPAYLAVFAACAMSTMTLSVAQCNIDQANIALPTSNLAAVYSGQQFGQTFTVGASGVLCEVAMYVDKRGVPAGNLIAVYQEVYPMGPSMRTPRFHQAQW